MSIKVLYILLGIGAALLLWAAVAIYLRVRRHLRASSEHGPVGDQRERKANPE